MNYRNPESVLNKTINTPQKKQISAPHNPILINTANHSPVTSAQPRAPFTPALTIQSCDHTARGSNVNQKYAIEGESGSNDETRQENCILHSQAASQKAKWQLRLEHATLTKLCYYVYDVATGTIDEKRLSQRPALLRTVS